ncbi:MAG: FumA C-terminus/TtdB family hydratase beta subunit [Coriobacteriales bacterium]|jgi:fumarate hydratase class I/fumarate hydratase subunit beta|nr:FumA C-terminus/TtdB family hydratase beta subunit [Coriobacteriales bacterium]
MTAPIRLELPVSRKQLCDLRVGDAVALCGSVYTMRDAGHRRALEYLDEHGELPFGLAGQALFYAGPTPAAAGRPFGAIGPTTASRMDFATPRLLRAGIVATLGKGARSPHVVQACAETQSVYLATTGGAAAYLAGFVASTELIAWAELGTEALRKLVLADMPAFVAIDTSGTDLYEREYECEYEHE